VQAETWAPVPGHLGQVWLGSAPSQVLTLTKALVRVKNNLMTRSFEFGSTQPLGLSPGERDVEVQFEAYSTDESVFAQLYQAAQTETPIPLTIQLGDQAGAMAAAYIKTFVPQIPQFDDAETRLLWSFSSSRAQGRAMTKSTSRSADPAAAPGLEPRPRRGFTKARCGASREAGPGCGTKC